MPVRCQKVFNGTTGNDSNSPETATAMVATRGEVNFMLSVWRLIGCRGGGDIECCVGWMENGAKKRREEEKKSGGKKLILSTPGSHGGNSIAVQVVRKQHGGDCAGGKELVLAGTEVATSMMAPENSESI